MSARPTTCRGGPGDIREEGKQLSDIRGEGKQHVGVGRVILGD